MKLAKTIALLMGVLGISPVSAEIYRCQDAQGRVTFTDRSDLCPAARARVYSQKQHRRVNRQFISQIPDLLQTHPLANFLNGGQNYCAPVAVSNSLSWLAGNQSVDHQIHLAGRLANPRYMNSAEKGTTPTALLNGVDAYFKDHGLRPKKLAFQGWRSVPAKYRRAAGRQIDLNWLADGISKTSTVWLNVGWYKQTDKHGNFKRVGGHWVTLVGYDLNNLDGPENRLIVHDPAPRSGTQFANEYVHLEQQSGGFLVDKNHQRKQRLAGLYRMSGGMHVSERADFALLDGAVRLDM